MTEAERMTPEEFLNEHSGVIREALGTHWKALLHVQRTFHTGSALWQEAVEAMEHNYNAQRDLQEITPDEDQAAKGAGKA